MIGWLRHQKHAFAVALGRLLGQPVSTLLTALAMGVAISLPGGLYLGLGNLSQVAGELPAQPEISVYLDAGYAADIMAMFRDFHQVGTTLVIATHDDRAIAALGGRILHLDHGKVGEMAA